MTYIPFDKKNDNFGKDFAMLGGFVAAYSVERDLQDKWAKERETKETEKKAREKERGW